MAPAWRPRPRQSRRRRTHRARFHEALPAVQLAADLALWVAETVGTGGWFAGQLERGGWAQEPVYLESPPLPQIAAPDPALPERWPPEAAAPSVPSPAEKQNPTGAELLPPPRPDVLLPWWQPLVSQPIHQPESLLPVSLEELIVRALENSSRIRTISNSPLIRETSILEADAQFDWTAFIETRWDDISEPVGSVLTTGRTGRFNDHRWDQRLGMRRRNTAGGSLEIAQRFGYVNNNSEFTIPNPQRSSLLALSYTQPLLRGGGCVYNSSLLVLAQLETDIAYDVFSGELQQQLLEVARAYWGLYLDRGAWLQKRRSYQRAAAVLSDLEHRQEIDAVASQVVRAQAETAARRAEVLRAETAVRNTESQIRMLVSDPELGTADQFELAPVDVPTADYVPVAMEQCLTSAFQNRPEISEAIKQIRAASVRLNMSKHELLPVLDLVLESYIKGLREDNVWDAWGDQFAKGAPSYAVGLQLEMPWHNRAAQARHQRRRLESRQLQSEFETTVETLRAEVEVAVREVTTSFGEMHTRSQAMEAAARDVTYIEQRWRVLPGEGPAAGLLLEDLLTAQERLAEEELYLLTSQVVYSLSLIELKRAMGTLLQHEQIVSARAIEDCLPSLQVAKPHKVGTRQAP